MIVVTNTRKLMAQWPMERAWYAGAAINAKSAQLIDFSTCYADFSCGGRIRTCDLQVMSLASYQLLHSAMLLFGGNPPFLFCECKGTAIFAIRQMFCRLFLPERCFLDILNLFFCLYGIICLNLHTPNGCAILIVEEYHVNLED